MTFSTKLQSYQKSYKVGSYEPQFLEECTQILDVHLQIWLMFQDLASGVPCGDL